MKKSILTALAACAALFCTTAVQAQEFVEPDQTVDVLQIGMMPGAPSTQDTAEVYGLRFGLPVDGGKAQVNGIDFAIIGSLSDKVVGFQYATFFAVSKDEFRGVRIAAVNGGKKATGAEIAAVNLTDESYIQIGAFNFAKKGLQLGLINVMEDGFLPVMILINFSVR